MIRLPYMILVIPVFSQVITFERKKSPSVKLAETAQKCAPHVVPQHSAVPCRVGYEFAQSLHL